MRLAAAVACAVVLVAAAATPGSAVVKPRSCGTVLVAGSRYLIRIEHGPSTCYVARAVLKHFIVTGSTQRLWFCFRGHTAQRWATACSKGRAIIRAYVRSG